jgi:hypothetical protein
MSEGWNASGKADLTGTGLDREGNLTLTFTVAPESKYELLPISDIRGRAFELSIRTQSKRVFAGKDGLEEARNRRIAAEGGGEDE